MILLRSGSGRLRFFTLEKNSNMIRHILSSEKNPDMLQHISNDKKGKNISLAGIIYE